MVGQLLSVVEALERLAGSIENGWSSDQTFAEVWGWAAAPLTKHDLSAIIRQRKDYVNSFADENITPELKNELLNFVRRIDLVASQVVPQLWGGNNNVAVSSIGHLLQAIDSVCEPYLDVKIDWQKIADDKKIPNELRSKLRSIEAEINSISGRSEGLDSKILLIENAYSAAESLPTDLQALQEARADIEKIRSTVEAAKSSVAVTLVSANSGLEAIRQSESEAAQLLVNCGDAYSAATTKGLGEAFSQKSNELNWSMWAWVVGLLLSLTIGSWLGRSQVDALRESMAAGNVNAAVVLVNFFVVVFSIAAPVWFAWVSTKQISHRFKLAEDYGFKASVAKAYEGYRREAARLDPEFAARLFRPC